MEGLQPVCRLPEHPADRQSSNPEELQGDLADAFPRAGPVAPQDEAPGNQGEEEQDASHAPSHCGLVLA